MTSSMRPLVYACSGGSSAAQLGNHLAVRLDREGCAEMSCTACLGGDVRALTRVAHAARASGRGILAIDGCPLACVKHTLARHGVQPTRCLGLWRLGVRKQANEDFDATEAQALLATARGTADELAAATDEGEAHGTETRALG